MRVLIILFLSCLFASAANTTNLVVGGQLVVGQQLTTVPSSGGGTIVYYVDSVSGSDTNSGTSSATPLLTLSNLQAKSDYVGATVYLKRGSTFREPLWVGDAKTNVPGPTTYVYAYGVGAKPVVSGADLLSTNWTLTSGKTSTYQLSYTAPKFQWSSYDSGATSNQNVMMVWDNNRRHGVYWDGNTVGAGVITNKDQLDTNPGCFFYTPGTLYVSSFSGEGNPATNGNVMEASVRNVAVVGNENFWVEDVCAEKAYGYNGSTIGRYNLYGEVSGTFNRCIAQSGANHVAGTANTVNNTLPLVFTNCYFADGEPGSGLSPWVAYKGGTYPAPTVLADGCTVDVVRYGATNYSYAATGSGFISHDTIGMRSNGQFSVNGIVRNCCVISYSHAYDLGGLLQVSSNCTAVGSSSAYYGAGSDPATAWTNAQIVLQGFSTYNCTNSVQNMHTNFVIVNSAFWDAKVCVQMPASGLLFVTNSVFGGMQITDHTPDNYLISIQSDNSSLTNLITSVGNKFYNVFSAYTDNFKDVMRWSDSNTFYGVTRIGDWIPEQSTSLAAWISNHPTYDANSTTNLPSIAYDWWVTNRARAVCADVPVMIVQPLNITTLYTNAVSFTAQAGGVGTLSYRWLTNGVLDSSVTTTNYAIIAANVQTNLTGCTFTCIVTNTLGSVTSWVASLTVTNGFEPPPPQPVIPIWTNVPSYRSFWLAAALAAQGTNQGAKIHNWTDQSGFGNTLSSSATPGTETITFTNASSVLNSKPAVELADNNNSLLDTVDISANFPSAATLCAIFWLPTGTTAYTVANDGHIRSNWAYDSAGNFGEFRASRASSPAVPTSGAHIFVITSDSSGYFVYIDGTTNVSAAADFSSGATLRLGGNADGHLFKGQIAELASYSNVLSAVNRKYLENYASTNYGISITP